MVMKDAMREFCVRDVVEASAALVATYNDSRPLLAAAVLDVLRPLVAWIDIRLVANRSCALTVLIWHPSPRTALRLAI